MKTQIRNDPGMSNYFQGKFQGYGMYQWNIKFYGFQDESEIEAAQLWAFGEHIVVSKSERGSTNLKYGFEGISALLERPIESGTAGRSAGWLVIDTELTDAELEKVDAHVKSCMEGVAEFLKEEREFHASEKKAQADQAEADLKRLKRDPNIQLVLKVLDETGLDYSLSVDGIKLI